MLEVIYIGGDYIGEDIMEDILLVCMDDIVLVLA